MSVEILLPFHGDPVMFREAVESVRSQTADDWRLLILDDHYPDASVSQEVGDLGDPRITIVRNEQNLGANANYRKALELATREYVVVFGADDRMLPDYVERMTQLLERHERPAVIQPGVRVIDESGNHVRPAGDKVKSWIRSRGPRPPARGEDAVASLLVGNWTYFPSLLWHAPTIKSIGFRSYDVVQDLALLVDVLLAGGDLLVDDAVTFEYRRHGQSDSSVRALSGSRFDEERAYFTAIRSELRARGWHRAARRARFRPTSRGHALQLLPRAVATGDLRTSARLSRHAFSA
jgi:glycosyltransferase involved in cell wall biosynthesis